MESEKEKMCTGRLYDANYDTELIAERQSCKELCYTLNHLPPSQIAEREAIIRRLFCKTKERFLLEQPFYCDYGYNIEIGENFYANMNCVILDEAKVTFGDNVFIAPSCGFYTAGHPLDVEQRNRGLEYARPIRVGNNVWIGAQVCILPGVTIGDNTVIGAGSVVNREPEQWEIKNNVLSMSVTPQSDYWRISHYGFTVDDAPFYYATYGGEFEAKVKVVGEYKERFDQAGLMLRIDHENYIKAGIEFVDGKFNLSTVVTHKTSDWSVITLDKTVPYIWIKAVRRLDAVEIFYSFDDKTYTLMRNAWLQDHIPVKVGLMAACPDGSGFNAKFEYFQVKHLPDQRRVEWLKKSME